MKRPLLLMLGAPLAAIALWAPTRASAQPDRPEQPSIIVSSHATVEAEANQVEISVSVVTEAKQSKDAVEESNRRAGRILEALEKAGLDDEEYSTGRFTILPIYAPDGRQRITGFRVENNVNIKTKKLSAAGDFLQAAIDAGANQVQDVSFTLSNPDRVRGAAVQKAVQSARGEANAAASAAGVTITGVRRITINPGYQPPRPYRAMRESLAVADASVPPLVPGEVSVEASVTVEFDIAAKPASN